MPTSEALAAPARTMTYAEARAWFRARHRLGPGDVVAAFHAVRSLPYRSGPDRTPLAALREGRGACTAKHLVLRDLLRDLGEEAAVELVEGRFGAGMPVHADMPQELQGMIRDGGVPDLHARVRLGRAETARRLDATWPDALEPLGFPVNRGWDGRGDTRGAMPGGAVRSEAEDVLAEKARLLSGLTAEESERRGVFLRLLSEWLASRA